MGPMDNTDVKMRPWLIRSDELFDRYDELNTTLSKSDICGVAPPLRFHRSYIRQMISNDVPYDKHLRVRDELFEYFDWLPEDKLHLYMTEITKHYGILGFRYLPVYYIPRLVDGRITKESLMRFIRVLFTTHCNVTVVLSKGIASLFLRLVLEGILTYDEMMQTLDEIDGLNNPVSPSNDIATRTLVISNYCPPNLPDDMPRMEFVGGNNDIGVMVTLSYWNAVLFTGAMREIISTLRSDVEFEEMVPLIGRLRLILGTDKNVAVVLLPCLALISKEYMVEVLKLLVTTTGTSVLFPCIECSGNVMDEHALVEKAFITLGDHLMTLLVSLPPSNRRHHLIMMYTEDV